MKRWKSRHPPVLPPPTGTILLYAADGLSKWRGHLSPTGKPRPPERWLWVPMFRQLVDSDEGLQTLRKLAKAGMRAWDCPPPLVRCLDAAFRDITFRAMSIAALHYFAETAPKRIVLSGTKPLPQKTLPMETKSRPERQSPKVHPVRQPHRPHPSVRRPKPIAPQ